MYVGGGRAGHLDSGYWGYPGARGTYPAWLTEVQEVEGLGWCIGGHGWWGQGVGKARRRKGGWGEAFHGEGTAGAKARQGTQGSVARVKGGPMGAFALVQQSGDCSHSLTAVSVLP